jgi:hypothetical protein
MIKNSVGGFITAVLFGIGSANADFVVVNNPVADTVGFYSDAFDSKGSYEYPQSGAQAFSLEDSYTTSSLHWWGSSNGFNGQGISNFQGFQIIVWNSDFSDQVFSTKINMSSITAVATGQENFFGQPEYEFYTPLSFDIGAGNYFMNIGVLLNDVNGDQFVWSQGEYVEGFWQTSPNGSGGWGSWHPLPPALIGNTAGGAFVLTAPAPGAIALLGLAGIVGRRRR